MPDAPTGWLLPIIDGDLLAIQDRVNKVAHDFTIPAHIHDNTATCDCQWGFRRRFILGADATIINERSEPVGLTKEHVYKGRDGDKVTASFAVPDYATATLKIEDCDTACAYVSEADSIPLALNVLGYNRPPSAHGGAGPTSYRGHEADTAIPGSQTTRDKNVALAIDLLLGADIFDQRQAAFKAEEANRAKLADDLVAAQKRLRGLSESIADYGVTAYRADELADATAKYKAAYEAHAGG